MPTPDEACSELDEIARVRLRPHMYFGSTGGPGKLEMLLEVVSNGVDQFLSGAATRLDVWVADDRFVVSDDGAGLDRASAREHLSRIHLTPTADHHAPHIHLGGSSVGLCAVNALCREFIMESSDSKGGWRLRFERGSLVEERAVAVNRGTRVEAHLDLETLSDDPLPLAKARRVFFDAVHLFPGLRIAFNSEVFHAPGGLQDLARFEASRLKSVTWTEDSSRDFGHIHGGEALSYTIACYGSAKSSHDTAVASWVNGRMTPGHGTHVDGALDALEILGWRPAAVMLSVVMKEPRYAGPTKDKLGVEKVRGLVREALLDAPGLANDPP